MTRRPTIIDVAHQAGVSKATVGRVVGGKCDLVSLETRDRVMAAVEALGYVRNAVAGSLRTNRTGIVALSIPDISNPFFPEVVRGVQDTLERHGCSVVTINSEWDPNREIRHLEMIREHSFDGLIVAPTRGDIDYLSMTSVPVVILGNGVGFQDYDSVGSDSRQAATDALDHLYELGHRRIGLIVGGSSRKRASTRQRSYADFHTRKGLELEDGLIVRCEFRMKTIDSLAAGKDAMGELLGRAEPPTAVLASNDILAIAALQAAQAQGLRVPRDISIVGLDDIFAASTTSPPLTTVAKPRYEVGAKAAQLLFEKMTQQVRAAPRQILLPCSLVTRGSTTAPPSKRSVSDRSSCLTEIATSSDASDDCGSPKLRQQTEDQSVLN